MAHGVGYGYGGGAGVGDALVGSGAFDGPAGGAGGGGYDAAGYPAPVSTFHTVRDRFLQQEAAGVYHRGPRCEGYVAPAPTTSGSYGYYPTPFDPSTANFTSHFAGSENLAGGGGRNANEAVIL